MSLKLLCDENLPNAVLALLVKEGHEIICPALGSPDSVVAAVAKKEKRILISFESDFGNILNYPPSEFFGIVRLNIHPPTITLVIGALRLVFQQFKEQKDFKGKLIIAEPASFRVWSRNSL